jgi:hypothetical protein
MPRIAAVLALACLGGARGAPPAQVGGAAAEYDVKAAFLYHFTRYLQWPKTAEPETFTIVVLGKSGIVAPLQEISRKKTAGSMPIVIRQCFDAAQIGHPRILFIANSAVGKLSQALEKTRGTDILTVGETEGLGARGVAVNFVERDGNVKFEMNEGVLKGARIQAGSQLLKLAILIDAEK